MHFYDSYFFALLRILLGREEEEDVPPSNKNWPGPIWV
jgi:hypothetical protein